jgi:hypothetical protein
VNANQSVIDQLNPCLMLQHLSILARVFANGSLKWRKPEKDGPGDMALINKQLHVEYCAYLLFVEY